jgi:hypothetical protein
VPIYVIYNKNTGEILHIHREYLMDSEESMELSEEEVFNEVKEMLPEGIEAGLTTADDSLKPVRGYRYYVDLSSGKLMLVENPSTLKEKK